MTCPRSHRKSLSPCSFDYPNTVSVLHKKELGKGVKEREITFTKHLPCVKYFLYLTGYYTHFTDGEMEGLERERPLGKEEELCLVKFHIASP